MHSIICQESEFTELKYKIIQLSADKLQKTHNYSDLTIISSRLKQIFKSDDKELSISQSTIERALDHPDYKKYKRSYQTPEDLIETPSQLQEIFTILEDSLKKQTAIVQEFQKKIKNKDTHDDIQNELKTILHDIHENLDYYSTKLKDQFLHMTDFHSLTEFLKEQNLELSIIPEYLDERKMLHPYMKLMLKQYMITNSFSSLAKRFDMSPKWMGIINSDNFLMSFVEKLKGCPYCGIDLVHFSNRINHAYRFGLPRPKPLKFFYNIENPVEHFTVRTITDSLLKNISNDINFCHYARCNHRITLQSKNNHCNCITCTTLIQNELNPNKCPCETCVALSKFKIKDRIAEQFYTDDDGTKYRKLYHVECIREQKENELHSITKLKN